MSLLRTEEVSLLLHSHLQALPDRDAQTLKPPSPPGSNFDPALLMQRRQRSAAHILHRHTHQKPNAVAPLDTERPVATRNRADATRQAALRMRRRPLFRPFAQDAQVGAPINGRIPPIIP